MAYPALPTSGERRSRLMNWSRSSVGSSSTSERTRPSPTETPTARDALRSSPIRRERSAGGAEVFRFQSMLGTHSDKSYRTYRTHRTYLSAAENSHGGLSP